MQKVIAMKDQGWHRRDMMVMAGAQCAHLLGRRGVLTAVQLATGCSILVLTEVQQAVAATGLPSGYSLGAKYLSSLWGQAWML